MTRQLLLESAKPILFNTEMVQAIINGSKTVTRRVVKSKHTNTHFQFRTDKYGTEFVEMQSDIKGETWGKNADGTIWRKLRGYTQPQAPYQAGNILYVRETWGIGTMMGGGIAYKATGHWLADGEKWKPSIHMPKEAARIFLLVTDVRAERLQDISANQLRNEGLTSMAVHCGDMEIALQEWANLWNSTIEKQDFDRYGWNANPWVWVINFERIKI